MPFQKIPKETILAAIAKIGPCQPIDIRREIREGDTMLIGAMLSELVAEGKLIISKTRRGGSPFYYDPAAPERLDEISQWLNEKDRRTYTLLKEQKVMREDAQDPLVRVGLKSMPDFSHRLEVDGIVYWRYYMAPEEEAARIVRGQSAPAVPPAMPAPPAAAPAAPPVSPLASVAEIREESKEIAKDIVAMKAQAAEVQERLVPAKPAKKPRAPRKKREEPVQVSISPNDWLIHDTLYEKVQKAVKGIITHQVSLKPHTELTCVMTGDGEFGKISYFLYALNKKKISEKDVTTRLLEARGKGMPLLVFSVEEIPVKLQRAFADTANVYFRRI